MTDLGPVLAVFATAMVHAALGAALGVAIERGNVAPDRWSDPWAVTAARLAPSAAVLAVVHALAPRLGADWQATTPGLFFVAAFFGVQTRLLGDFARLA